MEGGCRNAQAGTACSVHRGCRQTHLARHVDAIGDDATETEGELLELHGLLRAEEHARVDRRPAAQPLQGKRQEPHVCGAGDEGARGARSDSQHGAHGTARSERLNPRLSFNLCLSIREHGRKMDPH